MSDESPREFLNVGEVKLRQYRAEENLQMSFLSSVSAEADEAEPMKIGSIRDTVLGIISCSGL